MPAQALPARSARAALGRVYVTLGERDAARTCEEALRPFAADYHWSTALLTLAALAGLRGDNATALADLSRAEELARREGLEPDLALVLLAKAELGKATDVETDECRSLLESLAMAPALGRLDKLVTPGVRPSLLTAREIEVLRLVAQGKTNREIADLLVISERTVINHLSHILDKTGVSNRASAAAYGIREGLV
jgi:DNA-binding CsgD family transcriptional regulator